MCYFSQSSFDPQQVITGIVNELIDYCVRPGLIIASSIINDIIGEFETESSLHSTVNYQEKHKLNTDISYDIYKNTQLKKTKYPNQQFLKK